MPIVIMPIAILYAYAPGRVFGTRSAVGGVIFSKIISFEFYLIYPKFRGVNSNGLVEAKASDSVGDEVTPGIRL
jgi:hypothetical protein